MLHDQPRADQQNEDHIEVCAQLHQRRVERNDTFGVGKIVLDIFRCGGKLGFFVFLARKALDHAHTAHVFLNRFVEGVVFLEHAAESGHCLACDHNKTACKQRDDHHERRRERAAHNVCHNNGENEHQRCAYRNADKHHIRHLDVVDVGGHTGDQRRGGELVNVLKRIGLHLVEQIMAQIFCEARRGARTGRTAETAATQRNECHHDEQQSRLQDGRKVGTRTDLVDQISGDERDEALNDRLTHH